MNLTCTAPLPWTRYAANELGKVVQVAVIDHVKDGDDRAKFINQIDPWTINYLARSHALTLGDFKVVSCD